MLVDRAWMRAYRRPGVLQLLLSLNCQFTLCVLLFNHISCCD